MSGVPAVPDLQTRFRAWARLLHNDSALTARLPENEQVKTLSRLSPRKRDKHQHAPESPRHKSPASRFLMALLARRVLQLTLSDFDPALPGSYPLYCLEGFNSDHLSNLAPEISAEMENLGLPELDPIALAGLQLGNLDPDRGAGKRLRKRTGEFYTPFSLARYITERTLEKLDPNSLTVADPACGAGIFLLAALDYLHEARPGVAAPKLLNGRLYGLDLNPDAADLTRLALLLRLRELDGPLPTATLFTIARQVRAGNALIGAVRGRENFSLPLQEEDFRAAYNNWQSQQEQRQRELAGELAALPVFDYPQDGPYLASLSPFHWGAAWPEVFERGGFGAVLGNPPYVGFNDYSGVEKAYFGWAFPQVYNLKADLLYYFIYRGEELLKEGGHLGFVTSRFWKEAAFAARLREWLAGSTRLLSIEDRGSQQLFDGAEVDSCLLFLQKGAPGKGNALDFSYNGQVQQVEQVGLGKAPWAWMRRMPQEEQLATRLGEVSVRLGDIAECRTGVQSGLDEVFFIAPEIAAQLEPAVVKPAIKSADITAPGRVEWSGQRFLIYFPPEAELSSFPKLAAYLEQHRERLERRLRYRKPFPFYELQWPRLPELFEAHCKLVTPYKAPRNWFALDTCRFYFSTDVISVVFKPDFAGTAGAESFAVAAMNFLNSRLSTWQFRSYSKQVGGGQYDYYANPLKKLVFPTFETLQSCPALFNSVLPPEEVNSLVYNLYGLTGDEIALVEKNF